MSATGVPYNQTPERGGFGKTVGLQLYINQYQAVEALTMWYFALKNWHPGKKSLTSTFSTTTLGESSRHSTEAALREISSLSTEELFVALKRPADSALVARGWTKQQATENRSAARVFHDDLKRSLQNRAAGNGDLLRAFNKLKHGLQVVQDRESPFSADHVFLVASAEDTGPGADLALLALSTDLSGLRRIAENSLAVTQLCVALLALLPWFYFTDQSWDDYKGNPNCIDDVTVLNRKVRELLLGSSEGRSTASS